MTVLHEGSCLFIYRSNGSRLELANDVTLTEACELMLEHMKLECKARAMPIPVVSLAVRKVAYPKIAGKRKQSSTGWPKV